MNQTSRFTRARQLTSTVLPGRRPDGYADQVAGRLRRIAAARSTGMLPFSGRSDGPIYFRDGKVAYAESTRTPGPAPHDDPAADQPPLTKIMAVLAITEPTVDAALELLSVLSRYAKFRSSRVRIQARRRTFPWTRCWPRWPGVYAAGDSAIVAVVGTSSLNVGMLQYRAREIIERIAANSS
jgi:hypothetical protein